MKSSISGVTNRTFKETPSRKLQTGLSQEQSNFPFGRECQESTNPTFAPTSSNWRRYARHRRRYRPAQIEDRHFLDRYGSTSLRQRSYTYAEVKTVQNCSCREIMSVTFHLRSISLRAWAHSRAPTRGSGSHAIRLMCVEITSLRARPTRAAVCTENLSSGVAVVKSAQDGA